MEGGGYMRKQDTLLLMIAVSGEMPADLAEHIIGSVSYTAAVITRLKQEGYISVRNKAGYKGYVLLWSSIFVTLMANKIGGLQFGIYRNCQISSRVFHTAVAALPLTKANRSDFE